MRTYVEGLFGSSKSGGHATRGFAKFVGPPMVSLAIGLKPAVCNVRHQRGFYADDPDRPDHPLLEPDHDFHG